MLQNRVDPWGRLHAVPARGTLMGNRGILHDAQNRIVRRWAHYAWVSCVLCFGHMKRRSPFSPGTYSELFFLDEATAFAAGHRPCTWCQRARSRAFKDAWLTANIEPSRRMGVRLAEIDVRLHAERVVSGGGKATFDARPEVLPQGTMFAFGDTAYLASRRGMLPWTFDGYGTAVRLPGCAVVSVLTPRSVVRAFQAGFAPHVHPSAVG